MRLVKFQRGDIAHFEILSTTLYNVRGRTSFLFLSYMPTIFWTMSVQQKSYTPRVCIWNNHDNYGFNFNCSPFENQPHGQLRGDITGPEVHGGLGVTIAPQLKSSHPQRSVLLHIHPHNMPASIINIIISSYSFTSSSESLKVGILNPFFYYDLFYLLEVYSHSYLFLVFIVVGQ